MKNLLILYQLFVRNTDIETKGTKVLVYSKIDIEKIEINAPENTGELL